MNRHILFMALATGILSAMFQQSSFGKDGEDVADHNDVNSVTIALTHLDVDDTKLELSWKIRNNTEHDVWICDDVSIFSSIKHGFEVYLSKDKQSLLIRRRLDVPTDFVWIQAPIGRYVLLRSSQERIESLSLDVPVGPRRVFTDVRANSNYARRLVLEIGFYNEDMPGMIRNILEVAEKLNYAHIEVSEDTRDLFINYFKGIWIAGIFGGLSQFEEYVYQEGNEKIKIPYTWQKFNSEEVLRIEVDGVHIPYDANAASNGQYPPHPKGKTALLPRRLFG